MKFTLSLISFLILNISISPVPAETIGEEPEADPRKDFLRESTVSLKPKQKEISIGVSYLNQSALLNRSREVTTLLEYRFGISQQDEAYFSIPIKSTNNEFLDANSNIKKDYETSFKSFELGWKHNFSSLGNDSLDFIGTLALSSSQESSSNSWNSGVSANLIAVKSYDPVVIYAGAGIQHNLGDSDATSKNTFIYSAGLGFAITNKISLSGQIIGAYQKAVIKENNGKLSYEPTLVRISLTNRINNKNYIEPFIKFGLNSDSPNTGFGIRYTRGF